MTPKTRQQLPIGWTYAYSNRVPEMWNARTQNNLVVQPESATAMIPSPARMPVPVTPNSQTPIADVPTIYNDYIASLSATNPVATNQLKEQYNWYDAFSKSANNLTSLYNNFYETTDPYYNNFTKLNQGLKQDIVGKLNDWLQTAYSQYWPQGEQTRRVADYYAELANNIAAQNAVNLWTINAWAVASGANAWAVRNATSKANLDANTQFLSMKQKEIENYDNIYKNLNAYIDNFVSKYGNSQDKYVRDTYNQLLNYKTQIGQSYLNTLAQVEQAKLQSALSNRWSAPASTATQQTWVTSIMYRPLAKNNDGTINALWSDWKTYTMTEQQMNWLLANWQIN